MLESNKYNLQTVPLSRNQTVPPKFLTIRKECR
jgi:hypothetical protein